MPAPAWQTSGTRGAGPSRTLTPWPAPGTCSAPCSIPDCEPCLSQGRARAATPDPAPAQPGCTVGDADSWAPGREARGERADGPTPRPTAAVTEGWGPSRPPPPPTTISGKAAGAGCPFQLQGDTGGGVVTLSPAPLHFGPGLRPPVLPPLLLGRGPREEQMSQT